MTQHRTAGERQAIGRAVAAARAAGAKWKELEARHGLCRRHLRRLAQMSHFSRQMSHFRACAGALGRSPIAAATGSERTDPVSFLDSLFSSPKPPPVMAAPRVPTPADPAVEEARRRELIVAQKQRGRQSTILTGGLGVTEAAPVARQSLLGA